MQDSTQEIENMADDGQWWQIIADIAEDISEKTICIEGSFLILFAAVAALPYAYKAFAMWCQRGGVSPK